MPANAGRGSAATNARIMSGSESESLWPSEQDSTGYSVPSGWTGGGEVENEMVRLGNWRWARRVVVRLGEALRRWQKRWCGPGHRVCSWTCSNKSSRSRPGRTSVRQWTAFCHQGGRHFRPRTPGICRRLEGDPGGARATSMAVRSSRPSARCRPGVTASLTHHSGR